MMHRYQVVWIATGEVVRLNDKDRTLLDFDDRVKITKICKRLNTPTVRFKVQIANPIGLKIIR